VPTTSEIVGGQGEHRARRGSLGITNEFTTMKHKQMLQDNGHMKDLMGWLQDHWLLKCHQSFTVY